MKSLFSPGYKSQILRPALSQKKDDSGSRLDGSQEILRDVMSLRFDILVSAFARMFVVYWMEVLTYWLEILHVCFDMSDAGDDGEGLRICFGSRS